MSHASRFIVGTALFLTPLLLPGMVQGQTTSNSNGNANSNTNPVNGTTLSSPGNNAQTSTLVSPGTNPPNRSDNTVPVLVGPPTSAAGTTLSTPGSNAESGVQTIQGATPGSNAPTSSSGPGSTSNNSAVGAGDTSGNSTGATNSSGSGLSAPGNVIQISPGNGSGGGNGNGTNQSSLAPRAPAVRTVFLPMFPIATNGNGNNANSSNLPNGGNRNLSSGATNATSLNRNNSVAVSGPTVALPTRTLLANANGTLDAQLQAATCNQNWRQAVQIVDQAIAAAPGNQTAYRTQLLTYRGRLQNLLNTRAYVPNWGQRCTGG